MDSITKVKSDDQKILTGGRFKRARSALGLTQAEAASRVGLTKQAVSEWERGNSSPSLDQVMQILSGSNIDPVWVLTGKGEPPEPGVSADTSPSSTADPAEPYRSAEDVPPGRYAHLVQAGATWDYELTDPDSGTVRAAVQIRFMVAPDVRRRQLSSSQADGASTE